MTPLIIIALTIWMEARGEEAKGRELVASVIHNRAVDRKQSADRICLQPKQFSCWNDTPYIKYQDLSGDEWEHCKKLARELEAGTFQPITKASYFYNPNKCTPSWAGNMTIVDRYNGHIFLKEEA